MEIRLEENMPLAPTKRFDIVFPNGKGIGTSEYYRREYRRIVILFVRNSSTS